MPAVTWDISLRESTGRHADGWVVNGSELVPDWRGNDLGFLNSLRTSPKETHAWKVRLRRRHCDLLDIKSPFKWRIHHPFHVSNKKMRAVVGDFTARQLLLVMLYHVLMNSDQMNLYGIHTKGCMLLSCSSMGVRPSPPCFGSLV